MTQDEIGLYLGLSKKSVSAWECGRHPIPDKHYNKAMAKFMTTMALVSCSVNPGLRRVIDEKLTALVSDIESYSYEYQPVLGPLAVIDLLSGMILELAHKYEQVK